MAVAKKVAASLATSEAIVVVAELVVDAARLGCKSYCAY